MGRILVVDDDDDILNTIGMVLEAEGHACTLSINSQQALQHHETRPFDLIILDYRMPGISGADFHHRLRGKGDRTPILFLTADHDVLNQISEDHATTVMTKPFEISELASAVQKMCQ